MLICFITHKPSSVVKSINMRSTVTKALASPLSFTEITSSVLAKQQPQLIQVVTDPPKKTALQA
jgi:hypothetical protein